MLQNTDTYETLEIVAPEIDDLMYVICDLDIAWVRFFTSQEQKILKLYYGERLSFDVIAQHLDLTKSEVITIHTKCLKMLKEEVRFSIEKRRHLLSVQTENSMLRFKITELRKRLETLEPLKVIKPDDPELLQTRIIDMGLETRPYNALGHAGIWTIAEILEWSERDLLRLPNMGPKAINNLKACLQKQGLVLRSY